MEMLKTKDLEGIDGGINAPYVTYTGAEYESAGVSATVFFDGKEDPEIDRFKEIYSRDYEVTFIMKDAEGKAHRLTAALADKAVRYFKKSNGERLTYENLFLPCSELGLN